MNTKKLIGLLCWLAAFAIPFHSALLSTEELGKQDGGQVKGLVAFVAFVALIFMGYIFVDGSATKKAPHSH